MHAPVLPADTKPAAMPSRTRREATRMELSRLVRTALRGAILHGDVLAGMHDLDRQRAPFGMLLELAPDHFLAAHQNDLYAERLGGPNRPFDFGFGGIHRRPLRQQQWSA